MVDTEHSKCSARKGVRVQVPLPARLACCPVVNSRIPPGRTARGGRARQIAPGLTGHADRLPDVTIDDADPTSGALRIQVVEDEALIRMDLVEMLAEAGHLVVAEVADGEQAVAAAREHTPDLVLMDIKLPKLDGISAAEQIAGAHLAPVILLTAFSDEQLVERARDAGVMAYVVKPFTMDDLRPAIAVARARWSERMTLEAEVADLGDRLETRKRLDRAKGILMKQLGVDEPGAFRWLQKTAMDRRLGMREVADAVIDGMGGDKPS